VRQIEHIVVLMMENRSFDHYFGALNLAPELRRDVNGLGDNDLSNAPIAENPYLEARPGEAGAVPWCMDTGGIRPRAAAAGRPTPPSPATPAIRFDYPDPPHEHPECLIQWNGGRMDGFVRAYQLAQRRRIAPSPGAVALLGVSPAEQITDLPRRVARAVMGYYTGDTLPVYYDLADQFTICDNWYASFLGSTHPNRVYANAGFCGKVLGTGAGAIFIDKPKPVWDAWEDAARARGFSWRWYLPESEMLSTFLLWLGFFTKHQDRRRSFRRFMADCASGDLASVSIVEPPYSMADDHPRHDPKRGQRFVALVVKALLAGRKWANTALVITYDEHGGFFDHVPPPPREAASAPAPFDVMGVRVPAIVVSPYARPRFVSHRPYDHRSLLKSIAERWDLPLPGPDQQVEHVDWSRIESLWDGCFDFTQPPIAPATVQITDVMTDWLARFNSAGELPQPTDLVEAFVEMAHIEHLDGMRALMEEDYYRL
jgi:phospholipase C